MARTLEAVHTHTHTHTHTQLNLTDRLSGVAKSVKQKLNNKNITYLSRRGLFLNEKFEANHIRDG